LKSVEEASEEASVTRRRTSSSLMTATAARTASSIMAPRPDTVGFWKKPSRGTSRAKTSQTSAIILTARRE
jgi:hypothetical protein